MLEFLKPFWAEILKYGSVTIGLLIVWFKIRQSGKESMERKDAMETLKRAQESAKIENYVASIKPDKLECLRQRFNRD